MVDCAPVGVALLVVGWLLLSPKEQEILRLRKSLLEAASYEEWLVAAVRLDHLCGSEQWKRDESASADAGAADYPMLRTYLNRIQQAREYGDVRALMFIMNNVWNRDFCGIDSEQPYSGCLVGTKHVLEEFYNRTVEQLNFLTSYPTQSPIRRRPSQSRRNGGSGGGGGGGGRSGSPMSDPVLHHHHHHHRPQQQSTSPPSSSAGSQSTAPSQEPPQLIQYSQQSVLPQQPQPNARWRRLNSNTLPGEEGLDDMDVIGPASIITSAPPITAREKIRFFERARKSYGRTALCLRSVIEKKKPMNSPWMHPFILLGAGRRDGRKDILFS